MEASHDKIEDFSDGQKSPIQRDSQQDCAFDGAMLALVPIADAAHLVHGPSGCVGHFLAGSNNTGELGLNHIRFTTDMEESDIIFGGAKKLYKAILEVHRRYNPTAIFVYSTCVSAMIGDDINGATHDATEKLGIPVIPVDSPGFVGNKKSGIRLAGDVLLEHVIGTAEPEFTTEYDINLIGNTDVTVHSGAVEIESLLEKVGIRVLAKITGNARYKELCYAHRARLNVVISSKALLKMAKQMEKRFNISYIEESIYSLEEINNCLRHIAAKFGNTALIERTEKLIAEETNNLNNQLDLYRSRFQNKRIVLDVSNYLLIQSIAYIAKQFQLDIIPIASPIIKQEDKAKIKQLVGQDVIILEPGNEKNQLFEIIQGWVVDMLIAGASYQNIAIKAQIPFLDVNKHQHIYTGYTGIIKTVRQLYAAFQSPVGRMRLRAPWE